jgi:hypothetical protein
MACKTKMRTYKEIAEKFISQMESLALQYRTELNQDRCSALWTEMLTVRTTAAYIEYDSTIHEGSLYNRLDALLPAANEAGASRGL